MRILDLTAGNRAVWFDKANPLAVFVDIRPEVKPDVVADSRALPAAVGRQYDLVVFDPPHVNFGASANKSRDYGHHTTVEIRDLIHRASEQAWRVTRADALMAFKWNDHDQKLPSILGLMAAWWEPLFGHKVASRTKHSSSTCWVLLRRLSDPLSSDITPEKPLSEPGNADSIVDSEGG